MSKEELSWNKQTKNPESQKRNRPIKKNQMEISELHSTSNETGNSVDGLKQQNGVDRGKNFSSEIREVKQKVAQHFSSAFQRTVYPKFYTSEIILQEWRADQSIPRGRKIKRICSQNTNPMRMEKGSSLNTQEVKMKELWNIRVNKDGKSKNMGKHNILCLFSWMFWIMFDGWNKIRTLSDGFEM